MAVYTEEPIRFDLYDERTLSVVCPECSAAQTGRCLEPKVGGWGGWRYMDEPHHARVLLGHGMKAESAFGF
jgi:hypothetical protein